MLMCIDGSGPDDDGEYASAFRHSFIHQMVQQTTQARREYYRGPNGAGLHQVDLSELARESRELHEADVAAGGTPKVFLAGYSRGAAGVVHVAYILATWGIQVDGMFLFDAVDRSILIADTLAPGMNVDTVPENVLAVYHARRDPAAESRESFSNTATRAARPAAYRERFFLTTHGGIGGTPWGASGLRTRDRLLYESPDADRAARLRVGHGARIVEPFVDGTDGADEALTAWLVGGELSDGATTLTMAQEETGAQATIDWMWDKMIRLGAVREGSTPYLMTRARTALEGISPATLGR